MPGSKMTQRALKLEGGKDFVEKRSRGKGGKMLELLYSDDGGLMP